MIYKYDKYIVNYKEHKIIKEFIDRLYEYNEFSYRSFIIDSDKYGNQSFVMEFLNYSNKNDDIYNPKNRSSNIKWEWLYKIVDHKRDNAEVDLYRVDQFSENNIKSNISEKYKHQVDEFYFNENEELYKYFLESQDIHNVLRNLNDSDDAIMLCNNDTKECTLVCYIDDFHRGEDYGDISIYYNEDNIFEYPHTTIVY